MTVPSLHFSRVVDLSRPLIPDPRAHPWVRYSVETESIVADPQTAPPEGRWYVVTHLHLSGHAGTHVEAPLHAVAGGASIAQLEVERFFGEAAVVDLSAVPWSQPFGRGRLEAACRAAGGVGAGDIALLRFDWDRRSPAGGGPPYPEPDALRWLVDQGVKLVGIDSPGLEVPGHRGLVNHHLLFDRGIPLIESLAHLEQLRAPRVYLVALPLPAAQADAVPLRALAFEA